MRKYILAVTLCLLIAVLVAGAVACSNDAPVIKLDETGLAVWTTVKKAVTYEYCIEDQTLATEYNQAKLAPGQSIKVRAVFANGKTTKWSKTITFTHVEHIWEQKPTADYVETPATCAAAGRYYKACSICGEKGEVYTYGEKDLTNHDWQMASVVDATCEDRGYTVYQCTRCGIRDNRDYTDKLSHDMQERETVAPTCTEAGYTVYECVLCHILEHRNAVDALSHDWQKGDVVPATCTEEGYTPYTCARCHAEEKREILPALTHEYQLEEKVLPTCYEEGYSVYQCSRCLTRVQREFVSSLPHDYTGVLAVYTLLDGSTTCADGVLESKECTRCHDVQTQEVYGEHPFNHNLFDLCDYGCSHEGTVDEMICACGAYREIDVSSECETAPINETTQRCTDPNCAFNYLVERYTTYTDQCNEVLHTVYYFYYDNIATGLSFAFEDVSTDVMHDPVYQSEESRYEEDGLQVVDVQYQNVCSRCGAKRSYGYNRRYYEDTTNVRYDTAEYVVQDNGTVMGQRRSNVWINMPYGAENEWLFVEVFMREETLDANGTVLTYRQESCAYQDSADYCQCVITSSDWQSDTPIERAVGHLYRYYHAVQDSTCTCGGLAVDRCVWCGTESEPYEVEPFGHSYRWDYSTNTFICVRCGKVSDTEEEDVYLEDITAYEGEITAYKVAFYLSQGNEMPLSAKVYVLQDDNYIVLDMPDDAVVLGEGVITIPFEAIQTLLAEQGYAEYESVRLYAAGSRIDLAIPYTYTFEQTDEGLRRTATNALTGATTHSVLPVAVNEALAPADSRSGVFAYTFDVLSANTYDIRTKGLAEDSRFTFALYDGNWRLYENNVVSMDGERVLRRTLDKGTYYLVPSFEGETPYAIGLEAKVFCSHQYAYQFEWAGDVIVQTGECAVCHDADTRVQYEWHVTLPDSMTLVTSGARLAFAFTAPATGDYRFECSGAVTYYTSAELYDADGALLPTWRAPTTDNNFAICYACEEGSVYYLSPVFYDNSVDEYVLTVTAYCEHRYQCTYEEVEGGYMRRGQCAKCGLLLEDTLIPLKMQSTLDVALVEEGDDELYFSFTPTVSGQYKVYYIEKSGDYNTFVEMYVDGEYMDYEEVPEFYISQVYDLVAGTQYMVKAYVAGSVPVSPEVSIFGIVFYVEDAE